MVIAKRGAEVALARTISVIGARKGYTVGVIGPMLNEDAEPALEIGWGSLGYIGGG